MAEGRDKVAFTKKDAQRIAAAVRKVEGGDRRGKGLVFGFRGGVADDAKRTIYLGKVASDWAIDTTATVTVYQYGTFPDESKDDPAGQAPVKTVTAVNRTKKKVKADSWVLIGYAMESDEDQYSWYLLEEKEATGCESPPSMRGESITENGYSESSYTNVIQEGSGPRALFLEGQCLKWIAATEVTVVTSVSLGGNGLYFERQKMWVFASTEAAEPITIPTITCDEGSSSGSDGSGGPSY